MFNPAVNSFIRKFLSIAALFGFLIPGFEPGQIALAQATASLDGILTLIWGDGAPGTDTAAVLKVILTDDQGQSIQLSLGETVTAPFGGLLALDRKQVSVTGQWRTTNKDDQPPIFEVQSLQLGSQIAEMEATTIVSGSQPWISILCKFADVSIEPKNRQYFRNMYSSSYPGLDHYWREQSYNIANIANSNAVGWFTLPHPRAYYVYGTPEELGKGDELADDCTAAADAMVYYPAYSGVNLMFNSTLGCCAWGGARRPMTNDDETPILPMTWLPPWGFSDASVVAHEMGHGFGLPHSMGKGIVYNNPWDIMGDNRIFCSLSNDPSYGCLPQHTIAQYKDRLGWIPAEQKYIAAPGSMATITLERLAQPQTGNYLFAQIPIHGSERDFYTVEARQRVGYDIRVPGNAVVIHRVYFWRSAPAEVVDADDNNDTGDGGAMWVVGETFTDTANGISVSVDSATATGFQVTINVKAYVAISGYAGVPDAILSYIDGTPKTVTATDSGHYYIEVPMGWSGTVTPSLPATAFCPTSQTYTSLTTDKTMQHYAHTACPDFGTVNRWTTSFDLSHGWTVSQYVRAMGDVSGDGKADLVGFGLDGVYVALSNGSSFARPTKWTSGFDLSHGWTVSQYVRTVGDVSGDGKADLVGFGLDGVYVGVSTGTSFNTPTKWTSAFDLSHGWTVSDFVRTVGDVNADGKADVVGFGLDGVYISLSTGSSFPAPTKWTSAFDLSHGWTVAQFVRTVGDVSGDGKADLIGFGLDGVYVATSTGSGFNAVSKWTGSFALANGWTVEDYVRTVGDVNGDGKADVVGFGQDGVYIGLSTGTTFSLPSRRTTSFDLSHGWTVSQYVRTVGDVNGGGKADLVGFGLDGVYIALAQ